jgi:hypothetical protein
LIRGASNYDSTQSTAYPITWFDSTPRFETGTYTLVFIPSPPSDYKTFRFLDPFGRGWRFAVVAVQPLRAMIRELSRIMSAAELERPAVHRQRLGDLRAAEGMRRARRRGAFAEVSARASRRRIHRRAV